MDQVIRITRGIRDWNDKWVRMDHFLQEQQANFGNPGWNLCEMLYHSDMVVPFLDFDHVIDKWDPQAVLAMEQQCKHSICSMFGADPCYSPMQSHA